MKNTIIILLIILTSSVALFAQEQSACPKVEIIGPSSSVYEGQKMTFTIRIIGGNKEPEIKWSVDKGKILSGQGKSSITVATDDLDDETLTASAEIEGLAEKCKSGFSETGIIIGKLRCGSPVDDFGNIADDDVRTRIDAFIVDLQNNPNSTGIITQYGQPKDVNKLERLIINHLKFRDFDLGLITFHYREWNEELRSRLWRVPSGADTSCIH